MRVLAIGQSIRNLDGFGLSTKNFYLNSIAPRPGVITKEFFGNHANVRIYWGTPGENTSGAVFEEAVKLWAPGCDWAAALANIPTDLKAGRFSRPSDAVPVRAEQHALPLETIEELLQLRDDGVLTWRFIGISELTNLPLDLNSSEKRSYQLFSEQSAEKKHLAPLAFALARKLGNEGVSKPELRFSHSEKSRVRAGGVHVYVERLNLRPDSLDSIDCCMLAFMPARSTRGPNGAWVIERGPNHPLVKTFSSVTVWTLAGVDGIVRGVQFGVAEEGGWDRYADGLDLFPSEKVAQATEDSFVCLDDGAEEQEDRFVPLPLSGEQLLRLMASQDLLVLSSGQEVPLTWAGVLYCRASGESVDEVPSADDVVNRLKQLRDAP